MQDRRSFLATLGSSLAGGALATSGLASSLAGAAVACTPRQRSGASGGHRLDRIGLQLYTVRGEMQRDMDATLARVAATGYKEVEFAGYFNHAPTDVRAMLAAHGLTAPSSHISVDSLGANWSQTIDAAKTVGHEWLVVAFLPNDRRGTIDDYRRTAAEFNRAAAEAKQAGLRFAYHNHDFEFIPSADGKLPYDTLLAETDPALVSFEMDLYWTVKAGQDPLAYFARQPGRFPMVHLKDASAAPERAMRPVGGGTIDFKTILGHASQAGIQHYFVEHDNPTDPFASIEQSYRYLSKLEV
jgi:sugar phosphate isomerase/epimerase